MILEAARAAASRLFTAEFRGVFFKSLGLTLLALVALWFGLKELFDLLALPWIDVLLPGFPGWAGWLALISRHCRRNRSGSWPGAVDCAGDGNRCGALPR